MSLTVQTSDDICHICLSKITFPVRLNCSHKFCKPCIQECWKERIMRKFEPACPDCWSQIDEQIKSSVLPNNILEKHQEFQRQKRVDRDPNLHWCPSINCDQFVYCAPDTNAGKTKATCECGYEFCISCHEAWHSNKCFKNKTSWIRRIYKNKKIKRCPKCKTNIQKITGCNHMTCSVCLHQFCWSCGGDYHPSHYSTFSLCSLEGENRTDLLLMMLLLPLVLFFFPFTILFAIRKILKEWMDFYCYDSISFIIAFCIALPLGFLMQAFYPQVMLFLFTTWVRFHINKCKFRY
ncbi:unnamed protein product [Moneuplotes crassus]|uniref:RBR-type E3 ubiquitin transferase n=1 Tax=Euplotes crassus TaxID=5936 RepID=A0AAD1XMM5_EUPCR|nr:unnamed protein product [Moneuplotes crassus]